MQKKKSSSPSYPRRPGPPQQVRIIGGTWKRTPLPVLDAFGLRPTPDRVRETVFNWITHQIDGDWDQLDCLDLFAGSGALGFEAASRGANAITMIDTLGPVVRQLETIKDKLKADKVRVLRADAMSAARDLAQRGQRFDLIFLDPPYQQDFLAQALPLCAQLLKPGGLVYAESGDRLPFPETAGAEDALPEWLAQWELVRGDKAGMVHFHLLKLH
ncbi:16S rRNA (guanine(966)-N(2))-methyltransferase RsmD [Herbaspirillum sp. SJZ107]|uniref:16S rRNA (guanine(966)-N(2))-methyltransferase RsmD n=1 Tax=Herbaspirillum sp. SJZ107 TaxID=2572881 RepID=UPI0011547B11|nr:16S rRNA (guanine(966)-N(2))-methyltransferase RsmD [Herbaspirillum sp. SJZ107]TQK05360.1 16S rRNA (guanine(966)-N(2))-methyltransferase RsmD [Herbaspirillum sp. SJZ107]